MGAPDCSCWSAQQRKARRRIERMRRIEIAGFYAASLAAGFALGVLVMVAVS